MEKQLIDLLTDQGTTLYFDRFEDGGNVFLDAEGKEQPTGEFTFDEGSVKLTITEGKVKLTDQPHGISQSEFTALKNKYKKLSSLAVYDDGKKLTVWFKEPDMPLMENLSSKKEISKLEEGKLIYNTLKIAGNSLQVESNDLLLASMYLQCAALVDLKTVELKKW